MLLRAGSQNALEEIVTRRFPIRKQVPSALALAVADAQHQLSVSCLDSPPLRVTMHVHVEHFAPIELSFTVPCDSQPHFTRQDAAFVASRFLREYASQPPIRSYVGGADVAQLKDIPGAKKGRDDE